MNRLLVLIFISIATTTLAQYRVDSLNSSYDEQAPVISPDGQTLYFTRANHERNIVGTTDKGDIWKSELSGDMWLAPIPASNRINNHNYNAVVGFSLDGNQMILHHHYTDNKQGLSISTKRGGQWSEPKILNIPYFLNKSKMQSGSISNDGKIILLSLESYTTKGGEDLYVLFNEGSDKWTDPKNLGSAINTKYQEIGPSLSADNKTLFFASNGHKGGKGSFDIYKSERLDDSWRNWSKPVNVAEVNSTGRESSYTYLHQQKMAMYVTTQDSDGYGDIKFYKIEEPLDTIIVAQEDTTKVEVEEELIETADIPNFKGQVKDAESGKLIAANLHLTNLESGAVNQLEAAYGVFDIILPIGEYRLSVDAIGYISKWITIELDSVLSNYQITLSAILVGETVNLQSVLFKQGTDELIASSYEELDVMVKMMQDNPDMEIELGGHTDNRGSSKLNYQLSEKRVQTVKKYLQSKGVSGRRISGKGYGGSKPIASNKNEESRKLNRRVEFKVTKE